MTRSLTNAQCRILLPECHRRSGGACASSTQQRDFLQASRSRYSLTALRGVQDKIRILHADGECKSQLETKGTPRHEFCEPHPLCAQLLAHAPSGEYHPDTPDGLFDLPAACMTRSAVSPLTFHASIRLSAPSRGSFQGSTEIPTSALQTRQSPPGS